MTGKRASEAFRHALGRRTLMRLGGLAGLSAALLPRLAFAASRPDPLPHLRAFVERWVGSGKLPGVVVAVGRPGRKTQYLAHGTEGFDDGDPISPDSLFRLYSMTKPVTGMAAMMLVDEGKLRLDQPLADILPKFAQMQVQVTPDGSITDLRPARAPITIRHLLTHTSGLPYGIIQQGPIRDALMARGLVPGMISRMRVPGLWRGDHVHGLEAFADGLAQMPLVHEPGTRWSYSPGLDILARVIEVVTGKTYDVFLQERLFGPLGMGSTFFRVLASQAGRLTTSYAVAAGRFVAIDKPDDSVFVDAPPFLSGGVGLVGSPADYDRFLRMIGGGGKFHGKRVMSEAAVRLGTSNLLPAAVNPANIVFAPGSHFGAGGRVGVGEEAGLFGWSGAAGTVGMVDTRSGLTYGLYLQMMPPNALGVLPDFQQALKADLTALVEKHR